MKRVERSFFRRRWKRKLLGIGAAAAGALGFGGTVACAYGPGYAGTSCMTTEECRDRFGAGYVCSNTTGSTYGDCVKRTHFDRGLPDIALPVPDRSGPDRARPDRARPDRPSDRPAKTDRVVQPDRVLPDNTKQQ